MNELNNFYFTTIDKQVQQLEQTKGLQETHVLQGQSVICNIHIHVLIKYICNIYFTIDKQFQKLEQTKGLQERRILQGQSVIQKGQKLFIQLNIKPMLSVDDELKKGNFYQSHLNIVIIHVTVHLLTQNKHVLSITNVCINTKFQLNKHQNNILLWLVQGCAITKFGHQPRGQQEYQSYQPKIQSYQPDICRTCRHFIS